MSFSQTHIPPHLREHIFRAYEPLLASAVSSWPRPTSFPIPPTLSPITFLSGLRNAVTSLARFSWPTDVDTAKLATITFPRKQYCFLFSDDGASVLFTAPKVTLRTRHNTASVVAESASPARPGSAASSSLVPWRDSTLEEIEALCVLLDAQRVVGPFLLATQLDDEVVDSLQTRYNVAVVWDETQKVTVVA